MKAVVLKNGGTYIGHGLIFYNGDYANLEDDVADQLLAVTAPNGVFRFIEAVVEKEPDDAPPDDLPEEVVPETNKAIKAKLDLMDIHYPNNANKATLTNLYLAAMEAANASEAPEDSDEDISDEDDPDESGNVSL